MNLVRAKVTDIVSYNMASCMTDFRYFSKVNFEIKCIFHKMLVFLSTRIE